MLYPGQTVTLHALLPEDAEAAGLAPGNRVCLYKNDNGYRLLASAEFAWEPHKAYAFRIQAVGNRLSVAVNGRWLIEAEDHDRPWLNGQIGFGNSHNSKTRFTSVCRERAGQSRMTGRRRTRGSVKRSASSRLVLENSEMTAPSGPAWNQCRVSGGIVYCSPGRRRTS